MRTLLMVMCLLITEACADNSTKEKDQSDDTTFHPVYGHVTKFIFEKHDYLIFYGGDYFSAVVHSASCHYCDSLKKAISE